MRECDCSAAHPLARVVLTGGPGAGKTAVLELVRQQFCRHVDVLPEAASILFSGGFRRGTTPAGQAATQRAIFHTQRELEAVAEAESPAALTVCDRGTVDGFAYWPYPGEDFFAGMHTTREHELARYRAVIHLRTPAVGAYNHVNPLRIETARQAAEYDRRLIEAWAGHPHRIFVESSTAFVDKASRAIALIEALLPACCR
ncbi:MAG: ATP-binding protein [Archangiaceae bacterium]|nr:ATP-binding protein [Archangiaceae bacterium]